MAIPRGLTILAAFAYLLGLIGVIAALRYVGESWWVTAAGLYLPRFLLLAPLPFLALLLLLFRAKKLLWTQLAAALLVIFPLMGFVLPGPLPRDNGPVLRLLSFNVNSGFWGYEAISEQILAQSPDIVLAQEIAGINKPARFVELLEPHYPYIRRDAEFLVASRFPILSSFFPDKLAFAGGEQAARYVQYVLDTSLGKITIYNTHPISPRSAFYKLRGNAGLRRAILSGELFRGPGKDKLMQHMDLLELQLKTVTQQAARETNPVIIAGDLNMPTLGPMWHRIFSDYQDGFEQAGSGFGHTFPNRSGLRMWLRLDRVLASRDLAFVDFELGCPRSSDHYCVVAELQRR